MTERDEPTQSMHPVEPVGSTTGNEAESTTGRHRDALDEPLGAESTEDASITRHEERAAYGTEMHDSGRVNVRKHVETYPVEEAVSRSVEHADTSERLPATENDSGEVEELADGSISIPVFEEVLVVTKKLVVRERVVVRKHTVIDEHTLQTELRREHVTVDGDVEEVGSHDAPADGDAQPGPQS